MPFRIAMIGDADSPHLLKWARALHAEGVELWVASSRGFLPGFDAVVPPERRLALLTRPQHGGGNVALLKELPRLARWLKDLDADWIHAHYLTSHGTLAWLAKRFWRLRGPLVGSAWGSDILVTPQKSALYRWVTSRVLKACAITTSDSQHMAERMRELGAREVVTFPFGLEAMPELPPRKKPWLFFANRGLEPLYRPDDVLTLFAGIAREQPEALLVIGNDGSMRKALKDSVRRLGVSGAVKFIGRVDPEEQAGWYQRAQWYVSLPESDSVSVSVIEAMAYGCIPLLSDLPANRELVRNGDNGLIVPEPKANQQALQRLFHRRDKIAATNRQWVEQHALFAPAVAGLLKRMRELSKLR